MKKNDYWQMRTMEENQKYCDLSIRQQQKLLKELYKEQNAKLEDKINRVYVKMIADQKENGTPYINDFYRTRTYHELIAEFNKRAKAMGGEQLIITEKALLDMYDKAREITEKNIPKGTLVGLWRRPEAIRPEDVIKTAWVADGKNYSDRIWADKKKLVETLYDEFAEAVMLGKGAGEISKSLKHRMNVSFSAAMTLAITETAHIQIVGQVDKYLEMGFQYGKYQAVGDDRTCDECAKLDGRIFPLDEIRRLIPQHPRCRDSFTLELKEI